MNPNVHLIQFSTFSPSATNSHFIFNNNAFAHFDLNGVLNLKKKKKQAKNWRMKMKRHFGL